MHNSITIADAAKLTMQVRWERTRGEETRRFQCNEIVKLLEARGCTLVDEVTTADVLAIVNVWEDKGNAEWTIHHKLAALNIIGQVCTENVPPLSTHPIPIPTRKRRKGSPKWWLNPEDEAKALKWLRSGPEPDPMLADYIEFVCWTGLRVEEALRLQRHHFLGLYSTNPEIDVPGEKTLSSHTVLDLCTRAAHIAGSRFARVAGLTDPHLFPIDYVHLRYRWNRLRKHLGYSEVPTATLKALRRSFGARMAALGMPTEDLRAYYRHSSITTTQDYLHLIGSGNKGRHRKWFSSQTAEPQEGASPSSGPSAS